MIKLKADLHTHAGGDPMDLALRYQPNELVESAASRGLTCLAITSHVKFIFDPRTAAFARERGVLLVPGVESIVEGAHVIILNPDPAQAEAATFAELRALGRRDAVIIAPHPFFPMPWSLHSQLEKNADLFDAVEFCGLYFRGMNWNHRAVKTASRLGLPMVGSSDTHMLPYLDTTFSWIEAEEASTPAVVEAIRAGRVTYETRPNSWGFAVRRGVQLLRDWKELILRKYHVSSSR